MTKVVNTPHLELLQNVLADFCCFDVPLATAPLSLAHTFHSTRTTTKPNTNNTQNNNTVIVTTCTCRLAIYI